MYENNRQKALIYVTNMRYWGIEKYQLPSELAVTGMAMQKLIKVKIKASRQGLNIGSQKCALLK